MTTAPALAVFDLFVGEDSLIFWTPPLIGFFLIGEAFFVKLKEAPLGPFVVFWIGSVDFAVPVDGIAKAFGLFAEVGDVGFGHFLRCDTGFDGVIFGWEAKGVVAEWTHNIKTLLCVESGEDVNDSKITNVPNMKAGTRWVREHLGDVHF